jgi:exosortase A
MIQSILSNWKSLVRFGVILICLALLYASVMQELVKDWIILPDFSHGFLIPLVALYLVYERRKELSALSLSGHWTGLGLTILGILFLLLGNLATEYFTMRFSFIVVLGGLILFLLGKEVCKTVSFPLIFLIFMIPLPSILMDRITFPMQLLASRVAAWSLDLIGIPVLREGNIIQLSNISLEVAEACSGIRSLISLLALSVIFAYFTQKKMWKRILLILTAFPIAIITNVVRVTGTGILANHYGDAAVQGFLHGFSGWILFGFAFGCLLMVGTLLSKISKT